MPPRPMKAYETFAAFQADQTRDHAAILRALRKLVKGVAPELRETVKWGNGCWVTDEANVAYAHVEPDHVQFGFFGGSALKDPKKILRGSGKYVRHVRLTSATQIDEAALGALLKQAVAKA